jgi:hypothetical protein
MARAKKEKVVTQQVALRLTAEAANLLLRLAPSENKRGRYVSDLIRRAAQEAGLIEPQQPPTLSDRIAALERELSELKTEVKQQEET